MIASMNTVNPTQLALPPPPEESISDVLPAHMLVELLRCYTDEALEEWSNHVMTRLQHSNGREYLFGAGHRLEWDTNPEEHSPSELAVLAERKAKIFAEAKDFRDAWSSLLERARMHISQVRPCRPFSDLTAILTAIEYAVETNIVNLPGLIHLNNWWRVVRYVQKSRASLGPLSTTMAAAKSNDLPSLSAGLGEVLVSNPSFPGVAQPIQSANAPNLYGTAFPVFNGDDAAFVEPRYGLDILHLAGAAPEPTPMASGPILSNLYDSPSPPTPPPHSQGLPMRTKPTQSPPYGVQGAIQKTGPKTHHQRHHPYRRPKDGSASDLSEPSSLSQTTASHQDSATTLVDNRMAGDGSERDGQWDGAWAAWF